MKHCLLRGICTALCCAVVCSILPIIPRAEESSELDDLTSQYESLQAKQQEISQQLTDVDNKIMAEQEKQKLIEEQTTLTVQQIGVLREKIDAVNTSIVEKQTALEQLGTAIETTKVEIEEKKETAGKRCDELMEFIRVSYMENDVSMLDLLFGAESFGDFLSAAENVKCVSDYQREIMDELAAQQRSLTESKDKLVGQQAELETLTTQLSAEQESLESDNALFEQKQQELSRQMTESQHAETELLLLRQDYARDGDEIAAQQSVTESFIQNIINKAAQNPQPPAESKPSEIPSETPSDNNSSGTTSSEPEPDPTPPPVANEFDGTFIWPVQSSDRYVACEYGWRFDNTDFHTGIDVTRNGAQGKPYVAAASGTVIYAGWDPNGAAYNGGYGQMIMIDHGNGFVTLYAHSSALYVSVGQKVQQGEVIGAIGETGWAYGPHVHFEIRVNGSTVNPRSYL